VTPAKPQVKPQAVGKYGFVEDSDEDEQQSLQTAQQLF
jgi:hypothetical protein